MRDAALARYGLAIASVAVALVLQTLLGSWIGDRQPYVSFYLAVMVTARWAGLRPALFAVVLSFLAGLHSVTFGDPAQLRLDVDEVILSIAFLVFAPLIALFVDNMREAQRLALNATEAAQHSEAIARASERKIQRLVESSIIGIVVWEAAGAIQDATQGFVRRVG